MRYFLVHPDDAQLDNLVAEIIAVRAGRRTDRKSPRSRSAGASGDDKSSNSDSAGAKRPKELDPGIGTYITGGMEFEHWNDLVDHLEGEGQNLTGHSIVRVDTGFPGVKGVRQLSKHLPSNTSLMIAVNDQDG